jgi:hypothetical protein
MDIRGAAGPAGAESLSLYLRSLLKITDEIDPAALAEDRWTPQTRKAAG